MLHAVSGPLVPAFRGTVDAPGIGMKYISLQKLALANTTCG